MRLYYDSLTIEVGYEVTDIAKLELTEAINEHGILEITFRCEKKKAEEIIEKSSSEDTIRLYDKNRCLFCGMLSEMEFRQELSCAYLVSKWTSFTAMLDLAEESRAYTGASMQYTDVIDAVLAKHDGAVCRENAGKESLPGFVLQYRETDWNFLKRLAGKEGCVLIPDNRAPYACFSYGLPQEKCIKIEDTHQVRRTAIDFAEYARREAECMLTAFLQDCYCFQVKSEAWYEPGQRVEYDGKEGVIQCVRVYGNKGLVEKCYDIVPEGGVKKHTGIHSHFSGLHLPAIVRETTDTRIRVDFEMEQIAAGEERYFEYAVESSGWYCMPEQGSSVHIYLPENDEAKAYAVHSMRNTEAGAKHAQAASNPQVKSYTHPGGSAMKLDGGQLLLTADESGDTQASLGSDGTLGLKAKKISIRSAGNIRIGKSEHSAQRAGAPAEEVSVSSGLDISIMTGDNAYAYLGEQAFFKGNIIYNNALLHDAVEIPEEILNRNDGIEEAILNVNATAKEIEKQKVQEAKQKTGMGLFAMVAGAVAIAAVGICTCGVGLVAVACVAGTVAIACGESMMLEGIQDYQKAVECGDFSQSYNVIRDSVLGGNQTLYDVLTYGSVLICGIVIGVATGGAGLEALKTVLMRAGSEMALDAGMNLVMDYIDDGSINNGWESYFKSMCMTGCSAGMSMGVANQFEALKEAGTLSCKEFGRLRLAVDVGIDSLTSFATTGDVDFVKIFLRNYIANKLTLADPVDGATGSLYIPAVDMKLPDIGEDFRISRKYESVNPRTGLLGRGWTCSLESRLQYRGDLCHILCPDGHVESFRFREGSWHNDKGDSKRMVLTEEADGYCLSDVPAHLSYVYAKEDGRLLYAEDGQKHRSVYEYDSSKNGVLTAVTTFAGGRIEVRIENGRLAGLTDVLGRTVSYTYDENGRLVCVNQNGRGLTRYGYDRRGNITEITDQNNKRYTVNTFDDRGRVVGQHYPDGSSCEISYDDSRRSVAFFYPETGTRQEVTYNQEQLVTRIDYQDNTYEAYAYDGWQNRTYYRDRNGNETFTEYSAYGEKLKEIQPDGLQIQYAYGEPGYLSKETDSAGGCISYAYDSRHNLREKRTLLSDGPEKWSTERWDYDSFGRLRYREDPNGNRTCFRYTKEHPGRLSAEDMFPAVEITPEGYEYFYQYDRLGRKIRTEAEGTVMEYSYNGLHHITHTTDGEGNIIHEEYDNLGSLIRHYNHRQWTKAGNGGGYTYEYDYLDRLIRVRDPLGREKQFRRNGQGSILYESMLQKPHRIPEREENEGLYRTYDANGSRTCVTCPDGGRWESRYDAEGNLLYEGSPAEQGGKYYAYDAMGRVTEIRLADGTVTNTYVYDKKGRLVQEANALGERTFYAYDLAGRRTGVWEYAGESSGAAGEKEEDAVYRVTWYCYDAAGNVTEERRGLEAVRPLQYPHRFLRIRKAYDRQNRLIRVEDGTGAETVYAYDFRNNRICETQLINAQGVKREVHYSYDKAGRLCTKEESYGRAEELHSRTDGWGSNHGGNAGYAADEPHGQNYARSAVTSYCYDEAGNLTSVRLPEGGEIRFVYDAADRPVILLEEDRKNGICRSRSFRYHEVCALSWEQLSGRKDYAKRLNQRLMECGTAKDYHGEAFFEMLTKEKPSEVRYYSGKKALELYHACEKIYEKAEVWDNREEEMPDAGVEGTDYFTRRYRYDFRGNLLSYEDTLGNLTCYTYSLTGNPVRVTAADGSETTYAYDAQGRLLSKTNGENEREFLRTYDKLGRIAAETDGEGNTVSYRYHSGGQPSRIFGPDGKTDREIQYDIWGRPDRVTDGNGNTTSYQKDSWGRVIRVLYPDGSGEAYAYDYAGNVIRAEDAVGNETQFCYNEDSRLERIRKADGHKRYFRYDREGRCSCRKDENGSVIRLSYNMDGNPVAVTGSGAGQKAEPKLRSLYTYDERGFLIQASEGGTVYRYERDTEGNTLKKQAWGRTLYEASYDSCGRPVMLAGTRYSYDKAGRLQSAGNENGMSAVYRYNRNGIQTEAVCGNGLRTVYGYDSRSRLVSLCAGFEGHTPLLQSSYQYDGNGNRVLREERIARSQSTPGTTEYTVYGYDVRNRLTKECRDGRETCYGYDLAGNRTSRTQEGIREEYRYNRRNQLTELIRNGETISYQYDAAGNLVEENHRSTGFDGRLEQAGKLFMEKPVDALEDVAGTLECEYSIQFRNVDNTPEYEYSIYLGNNVDVPEYENSIQYTYDAYNRNTGVTGKDFCQKNIYDAEGYRCGLEENGRLISFTYRSGLLLEEADAEAGASDRRSYVPGNNYIGTINSAGQEAYYITDEQGSLRFVLDASGRTESYYQYDAFGETIAQEGSRSRLQYNSQIRDELSGLYYLRARYYQPGIGRFTQEDVIYNDGLNLYAYCNSNPVIYCDPSGFEEEVCKQKNGDSSPGAVPEDGSGSVIHNDVLDSPRTGSALKVDDVSPIYEVNEKTGRPQIVKEFPASAQAHGFNDIVDNYAGYATKTSLDNANLYQLEGSLNGVSGRFEWIIQDGQVTHRMFIQNGTMNGVPIKP